MGNSLCLCRALSIYEFKSDRLLAAIAARYRKKMEEYRAVVIEAGVTLPVKLGLYLPAVDRFVEL